MAQTFVGTVSSVKMNKTVTITIENRERHPMYKKVVNKKQTFKAHNDGMELQVGDVVEIQETRPISKTVHFKVTKKI